MNRFLNLYLIPIIEKRKTDLQEIHVKKYNDLTVKF